MIRQPFHFIAIISLGICFAVFSFTPQLSQFMVHYLIPEPHKKNNVEIGQILEFKDKVWQRHQGGTHSGIKLFTSKGKIEQRDLFTVAPRSSAQLGFNDGTKILLKEKTKAIVELWNPEDVHSPILLNIFLGDFELIQEGSKGSFYIVQNQQIFTPSRRPIRSPFKLTLSNNDLGIAPPAPPSPHPDDAALNNPNSPTVEPETSQTNREPSSQDSELKTLSDKYIENTLASQKTLFQICQKNAIRESGDIKGTMLVGFSLLPTGKLEQAQILQTSFENKLFMDCILNVFKNTTFTPFKGDPIAKTFPLEFE